MASTELHGDDEAADEVCEGCAVMDLRHQMLSLAVEASKSSGTYNPSLIVAMAKAFEAYILDEDNEQPQSSGTH